MANNIFYVKRTTVTGRTPNTTASYATNSQYIATGELALNLTDFKKFTSNGTTYYEIGANLVNHNVTNNFTFSPLLQVNTTAMYVNSAIFLGGSNGTVGQVLTSNGTSNAYWSTVSGGGGTPGGSNTDIQYNNSGSFAGSGGIFTYNYVTSTVTANNLSIVGNATINTTVFTIGNSTGNTTISANGISIDNTSPNTSFQLTVTGNSYLQGSVVLANGFPGQIYAVAVGFALV